MAQTHHLGPSPAPSVLQLIDTKARGTLTHYSDIWCMRVSLRLALGPPPIVSAVRKHVERGHRWLVTQCTKLCEDSLRKRRPFSWRHQVGKFNNTETFCLTRISAAISVVLFSPNWVRTYLFFFVSFYCAKKHAPHKVNGLSVKKNLSPRCHSEP